MTKKLFSFMPWFGVAGIIFYLFQWYFTGTIPLYELIFSGTITGIMLERKEKDVEHKELKPTWNGKEVTSVKIDNYEGGDISITINGIDERLFEGPMIGLAGDRRADRFFIDDVIRYKDDTIFLDCREIGDGIITGPRGIKVKKMEEFLAIVIQADGHVYGKRRSDAKISEIKRSKEGVSSLLGLIAFTIPVIFFILFLSIANGSLGIVNSFGSL
jgi:hypothetical protein